MFQSYRKLVNTQLTFTCSKATIETLEALEKVNDVVLMSLLLTYFTPFYGWDSTVSRLQSHYKETVYFLSQSPYKFLVLK